MIDRLDVHIEIDGATVRAGTAYFAQRRGAPVSSTLSYADSYLALPHAIAIDPHLPLVSGPQPSELMPGAFQDCAPDRWGRNLILKRNRFTASEHGGRAPSLNDVDFLAGVSDLTRQGALRFTMPDSPTFVDVDVDVPKLIALPGLLHAVDELADDEDNEEAIKALLAAGSGSLGGARPKASVHGDDGQLLLAKFPHRNDDWDVMGWEKTAHDIAERAGIDVPARRLIGFERRHILVLNRFDRAEARRIPYISAMTLIGGRSGGDYDYGEIAEFLPEFGARVDADLAQIFRRSVLNCAIHNTDDHLRNHGFLAGTAGWRLSPVFDINPNPDLDEDRVTSIGAATRVEDEPDGLMTLAGECRLNEGAARAIVADVLDATAGWADAASANGISAREQTRFRPMFEDRLDALGKLARKPRGAQHPSASDRTGVGEQPRVPKGNPTGGRFTSRNAGPTGVEH